MSHQSNRVVTTWEIVESRIRRSSPLRRGRKMEPDQVSIWKDSLFLFYLCWYDKLTPFGEIPQRLHTDWVDTIISVDAYELADILKTADEWLLNSTRSQVYMSYDDFKHHLSAKTPFAGRVFGPAKRIMVQWCDEHSIDAFGALHTMFSFMSRVSLPGLRDLQEEAIASYLENDARLPSCGFTELEASIITRWFPRDCRYWFYTNWSPKHGNGAVADCKSSIASKYRALGCDNRLRYLLNKCEDRSLPCPTTPFERTAKVVFVPKSVSKLRTICMEPATLQWAQQGFGGLLEKYFSRHKYLSRRIDLTKSSLNADLAYEGSFDGHFSTIDLSSASDSVSSDLVKAWFAHSGLREILWCCRSNRATLPDGTILSPKKYAPMGSNLCFPIECIVFAAMCEATIIEQGGDPVSSRYRVYGDDIVIESKYSKALISRLEMNGFVVNVSKTFTTISIHNFRESCGGEYLDGADVTPIRISRKFDGYTVSTRTPERITRLVTFANECNNPLPSVRRFLISRLNRLPRKFRVPFDILGEGRLFSPTPSNYHLNRGVYDDNLQAIAYTYGQLQNLVADPVLDEEQIRLYEYLRVADARRRLLYPEDACHVSVRPPRSPRWVSVVDTFLVIG